MVHLKDMVELFGNGGFEADFLLRYGMDELQHLGVQAEPVDGRGLVAVPVDRKSVV